MFSLSSLFRSAPRARRSSSTLANRRAAGLSLQRLEERWTPAVSVMITDDNSVTIVDDDSGKTNNTVEIVDDYFTNNTYIKINGGPLQLLNTNAGANGKLQNIGVNMGGGNDKVIFRGEGDGALFKALDRSVWLGAGNDSLHLKNHVYLNGFDAVYTAWGQSGNDKITVDATAVGASLNLNFFDDSGSDSYDLKLRQVLNASLGVSLLDVGGGSNKFRWTPGTIEHGTVEVELNFSGAAKNNILFADGVTAHDGSMDVTIIGGAGKDVVKLDDGQCVSFDVTFTVNTGEGNDSVTTVFDGRKALGHGGVFDSSLVEVYVDLGEGNDAYNASFVGKSLKIDSQGNGTTGVRLHIDGGVGNDKLTAKAAGSTPLGVNGSLGQIRLNFSAGDGNDAVKVDLGKIVASTSNGAYVRVNVNAGAGADKLSIATTFGDLPGFDFLLFVTLGDADGVDSLSLNIVSAPGASAAPGIIVGSAIDGGAEDVVKAKGLFFGQSITDLVPVALS